jgi:hypothetical protein
MKQTGKATRERQKFNPWTPRALVGHCQNLMDGSEIVVELSPRLEPRQVRVALSSIGTRMQTLMLLFAGSLFS